MKISYCTISDPGNPRMCLIQIFVNHDFVGILRMPDTETLAFLRTLEHGSVGRKQEFKNLTHTKIKS